MSGGTVLRELVQTSAAIFDASLPADGVLQRITAAARELIGAHQAVTSLTVSGDWAQTISAVSLSEKYARWRDWDANADGSGIYSLVCKLNRPFRMTQGELESHPSWKNFGRHAAEHPPMRGWLAAPLTGRDGRNLGLIQLSDWYEDEFTAEDEALLVQLAQLASTAAENLRLFRLIEDRRAEAENALQLQRETDERFRRIVETAEEGVWTIDENHRTTFMNARMAEMLGLRPEDAIGEEILHYFDSSEREAARDRRAKRSYGVRQQYETVLRRKDGSPIDVLIAASPLTNPATGEFAGSLKMVTDISKRVAAERALRSANRTLQGIIDASPVPIFSLDLDGAVTSWNAAAEQTFGWTAAEAVGQRLPLVGEKDAADYQELLARGRAGESLRGVERRRTRKDGSPVDIGIWTSVIRNSDGGPARIVVVCVDITESKRLEEERQRLFEQLEEKNSQIETVLESTTDSVMLLDREWTITYMNRRARLEVSPHQDITGRIVWDIFPRPASERFFQEYSRALEEQRPAVFEAFYEPLNKWFAIHAYPSLDNLAVFFRDVSAQKLLEEQLAQAQRMEVVGQLAGGVSHDFNNLLTVINGYASLVLDSLGPGHPERESVEQIARAGQRATVLTRQLLAFSRRQILQPKVVDVNSEVRNFRAMIARVLRAEIDLVTVLQPDVDPVLVDSSQLEQVLMNLVLNAQDAIEGVGKITIETANVEIDEIYASRHAEVETGSYVRLAVSDTGCGMDARTASRIFEPFFTTKGPGAGTGLGLSTAFGIVRQSGGHIWVYSEPGHGTAFRIYLPAVRESITGETAAPSGPAPMRGAETVLLAEDDEQVRDFAAAVLNNLGYTVLLAGNGQEAFDLASDYPDPIDLLVTDVILPKMNGRELAEALKPVRPGLKVLFVSGYTENAIVHHGILDAGIQYLPKPFDPSALARSVRAILDSPKPPLSVLVAGTVSSDGVEAGLASRGYAIRKVSGLTEALERQRAQPADLVIFNGRLEDAETKSGLRKFKRGFPHARVLVIRDPEDSPDASTAADLGASPVLQRPLGPGELLDAVRRLIG